MTPELVIEIGQRSVQILFMVAAPILFAALAAGLLVSVFQAATQINEMTLSFIPKLIGIFLTIVLAGPYLLSTLVDYVLNLYMSIPQYLGVM